MLIVANPPMVWPFKICLLAKWISIFLNLLKHSIIFCYCTTTPFNTLWKDLKGRTIGLWYTHMIKVWEVYQNMARPSKTIQKVLKGLTILRQMHCTYSRRDYLASIIWNPLGNNLVILKMDVVFKITDSVI